MGRSFLSRLVVQSSSEDNIILRFLLKSAGTVPLENLVLLSSSSTCQFNALIMGVHASPQEPK